MPDTTTPFKLTTRLKLDALSSPPWLYSMMRNGIPRFVTLRPYMDGKTSVEDSTKFIRAPGDRRAVELRHPGAYRLDNFEADP